MAGVAEALLTKVHTIGCISRFRRTPAADCKIPPELIHYARASRATAAAKGKGSAMDEDLVVLRLMEEGVDGSITCAAALRLAEELGIPPRALGEAANKLGIKIDSCQLGCF
jgi:hypothetical protein